MFNFSLNSKEILSNNVSYVNLNQFEAIIDRTHARIEGGDLGRQPGEGGFSSAGLGYIYFHTRRSE